MQGMHQKGDAPHCLKSKPITGYPSGNSAGGRGGSPVQRGKQPAAAPFLLPSGVRVRLKGLFAAYAYRT